MHLKFAGKDKGLEWLFCVTVYKYGFFDLLERRNQASKNSISYRFIVFQFIKLIMRKHVITIVKRKKLIN